MGMELVMKVVTRTGVEVYGLRKALRDKQETFAERLGASVEAISKWERGGPSREVGDYYAAKMDNLFAGLDEAGLARCLLRLDEAKARHAGRRDEDGG
jgi:transcriptional regulator with XRE-family HTH domain